MTIRLGCLLPALFGVLLGSFSVGRAKAEPSVFPTGTTRYDPTRAYNSFIAFAGPDGVVHLIDMNGNEVHRWVRDGFPAVVLDPALAHGQRGHVLVQLQAEKGSGTAATPGLPAIFRNKSIGEVDWTDKVVWEWGGTAPNGAARQHHDLERLPNGNTLLLVNVPRTIEGGTTRNLDDALREVAPDGRIVWSWIASDHLDEFGFSPESLRLIKATKAEDYLHLNSVRRLGANKWFEGGDKRFAPDNIMISSRNANIIAIVDRASGKIVWRLGPDYTSRETYKVQGRHNMTGEIDQISGQHDPHIIAKGLPGAGNLLVFDNQGEAGYPPAPLKSTGGSRVLEIDPITTQILWTYAATLSGAPHWTFFSSFISDARRLPNGNTFIDEGMNGRLFQVTPQGEIVWEYVSCYFSDRKIGDDQVVSNWLYRGQPVPYDWVPAGTPHGEAAVTPPALSTFRVPASPTR